MISVSCYGEILWDNFPTYRRIGGAPLNVALRMHSLGARVQMMSRLGKDKDAEDVLFYLKEQGLSDEFIQTDPELKTGTVDVHLDETRTATYTINYPAAWDNIELSGKMKEAVGSSDALIFGSLATRSQRSQETLKSLLKEARFKVFDINLRPPHYDLSRISELLRQADLVKMNDEELDELGNHLHLEGQDITQKMMNLHAWMPSEAILCVTKGAAGAQLLYKGQMLFNPGYPVKVADTVGAGDSFLATLCHDLLSDVDPQEALDRACAMGSLVASKEGAIALVKPIEIDQIIRNFR